VWIVLPIRAGGSRVSSVGEGPVPPSHPPAGRDDAAGSGSRGAIPAGPEGQQSMSSNFVSAEKLSLPVVPLRDMVVFPHMMAPFIVGREGSVRALERTLQSDEKRIFLIAQRDPKID